MPPQANERTVGHANKKHDVLIRENVIGEPAAIMSDRRYHRCVVRLGGGEVGDGHDDAPGSGLAGAKQYGRCCLTDALAAIRASSSVGPGLLLYQARQRRQSTPTRHP
jgi:hypothetical protein